jgi:hypothetical protein
MEVDYRRPFTMSWCLGNQNVDADGMVTDLFVGGLDQIEALEFRMRGVEGRHSDWQCTLDLEDGWIWPGVGVGGDWFREGGAIACFIPSQILTPPAVQLDKPPN